MNRLPSRTSRFTLGVGVLAALLLLMLALAPPAAAQPLPDPVNLDYDYGEPMPPPAWVIPPTGAIWHEMWPTWCRDHTQGGYIDNNGDSVVSPCDIIQLSGAWYHVDDVYPTYFFSPVSPVAGPTSPNGVADPVVDEPGSGPVNDTWHIIHSDGLPLEYCQTVRITGWEDNNDSGALDVCDNVQFDDGAWYHIDAIHCDITVSPDPTDAKQSSWGWLKNLFNR